MDKFAQMGLSSYYDKNFERIKVEDVETEEEQLLKQSGFAYVEKMIVKLMRRK